MPRASSARWREGPLSDSELSALLEAGRVAPERTEAYGPHEDQVVDFYGESGPGPDIAVVHGGFWRQEWDRGHLTPFASALAARGMRVALIEYRRVGDGGGWPQTAEDVQAALDLLGAPPAVLLGHSAGGQLALHAAAVRERAAARVLTYGAVADLQRAWELRLSEGAAAAFLGRAAGPETWAAADPMRLLPRVPVELLHGTADTDVPLELSRRYANNWGARLHLLPGSGHFAALVPHTPAFGVLARMLA
ncbi:alpha/beta hydrolase family protein [Streptomyces xiaopingdaonensis]|uniref:alpha/beta hydrolase family protein n=1 Tax=Streptomyces xiaopingdaonensis TaxID=1565415 RepID=UPI0003770CFF|nr:alpha/beta hydrolase [Streptomyces xiaopingdaonensis]